MSNSLYIVFNLNSYLGGGEVIAVKLTQYLKFSGKNTILACSHESYIQRNSNNLDKIIIPSAISLIYGKEQLYFFDELVAECRKFEEVNLICLNMRELYNAIIIVQRFKLTHVKLFFYVLHPGEPDYLCSFSWNKIRKIEKNRAIISQLSNAGAVAFCSINAVRHSNIKNLNGAVCGLPFDDSQVISNFSMTGNKKSNSKYHLMISRVVWAKLGSCLTFLLLARKMKSDKFGLIGYGPLMPILKMLSRLFKVKNIVFHGKLYGNSLLQEVNKSDIGYAQGMSMFEFISKYKHVICMQYSDPIKFMRNPWKCYGNFDRLSYNNYGDLMDLDRANLVDIVKEVERITAIKFDKSVFDNWISKNSSNKVFSHLLTQIDATQSCVLTESELIQPTKIRRFFRYFANWFRT